MDSFEINKIIAAVLMVALLVIGIGKLSDVIFHVKKPDTPGYSVEVENSKIISATSSSEDKEVVNIAALMAMGDIAHSVFFRVLWFPPLHKNQHF